MRESSPDFKIKVREGGRVIIPSAYRRVMGIHSGDELVMRLQDGELRLFQQTVALRRLRAAVKRKTGKGSCMADFLAFRKADSGL